MDDGIKLVSKVYGKDWWSLKFQRKPLLNEFEVVNNRMDKCLQKISLVQLGHTIAIEDDVRKIWKRLNNVNVTGDQTNEASSSGVRDPPDDLICPISGDLMRDPVQDCFGHTYDRNALQTWVLKYSHVSPKTRQPYPSSFRVSDLPTNYALKGLCDEWKEGTVSVPLPGAPTISVKEMKDELARAGINTSGLERHELEAEYFKRKEKERTWIQEARQEARAGSVKGKRLSAGSVLST